MLGYAVEFASNLKQYRGKRQGACGKFLWSSFH